MQSFMQMTEFSQDDLYRATRHYVENQAEFVREAEATVVEWRYATAAMRGMYPLFETIEFRGSDWE